MSVNDNQLITKLLQSDFFKVLVSLILFVMSSAWTISNAKNEITQSITEINHKIELQNTEMKYELKEIREKQDRDFRYITENYVKKSELRTK